MKPSKSSDRNQAYVGDRAFAWKIETLIGINLAFWSHKKGKILHALPLCATGSQVGTVVPGAVTGY
jgi:hypothetical protein